jgi:catechol-2,3-dioxygenase
MDLHFAIGLEDHQALAVWKEKLTACGIDVEGPVDHGIFTSIYFHDPDGYRLEFAAQNDEEAKRFRADAGSAHAILRDWVAREQGTG